MSHKKASDMFLKERMNCDHMALPFFPYAGTANT